MSCERCVAAWKIHDSCVTGGDRRSNRLFNYIVWVREPRLLFAPLPLLFIRCFYVGVFFDYFTLPLQSNETEWRKKKTPENKLFIELIDFLHDSIFFSLFAHIVNPFCGAAAIVCASAFARNIVSTMKSIPYVFFHFAESFAPSYSTHLNVFGCPASGSRATMFSARETCNDFCFCYSLRYSRRSDAVRIATRYTFTIRCLVRWTLHLYSVHGSAGDDTGTDGENLFRWTFNV